MSKPDLSILIPTKDRFSDLRRLLDSLAKQSDKEFEIIIVNNGRPETTATIESMSKDLPVRIVQDSTPNLTHLFNHGLNSTEARIVGYLNDDTEVNPSWVREVKETFAKYPDIAAVGGPAIDQGRQLMQKTQRAMESHLLTRAFFQVANTVLYEGRFLEIGYMSNWGTYSIGGSLPSSADLPAPILVDALSITNMAVNRALLKELGGFDENFGFAGMDGDMFVRLRRVGAKLVFNPKLGVLHFSSTKGNLRTRSIFWLSRDHFLFLRKLSPRGLSGQLKRALVLAIAVSLWSWNGISNGHPSLAFSSFKGLNAGLRIHLSASDKSRSTMTETSPQTNFTTRFRDPM